MFTLVFQQLTGFYVHGFFSSAWNDEGGVIKLKNQDFNSKTKEYDVLLVMFYVRWCSYCQQMHPDYERAGTKLLNMDTPIHLAKLDCTNDNEARCYARHQIDSYPTLRIYRYGHFMGEELNHRNRTTDEIVRTMQLLKKDASKPQYTLYTSDQKNKIKDEVNKATAGVHWIWLFIGLIILIFKPIQF